MKNTPLNNFGLFVLLFAFIAAAQSVSYTQPARITTFQVSGERIAYLKNPDGGNLPVCTSQAEARIPNPPTPLVQSECNQSLQRSKDNLTDALDAGALEPPP